MIPRIAFLLIAVFWIAMNILLWRAEYVHYGNGIRVPMALVLQKILTAPDISSLTVFQDGDRIGFCEFSTSVEQEMATLDEGKPVPEGVNTHAGYQIRFNGNVGLGDFTNRLTFNGILEFTRQRAWRELNLKVSSHFATIEIHSLAADRSVQLTITTDELSTERVFSFDDLENPNGLMTRVCRKPGRGLGSRAGSAGCFRDAGQVRAKYSLGRASGPLDPWPGIRAGVSFGGARARPSDRHLCQHPRRNFAC